MLNHGIIRESKSPFASPTMIVKKRDGVNRKWVNYRKIIFGLDNVDSYIDDLLS